jgi:hypothetical protein
MVKSQELKPSPELCKAAQLSLQKEYGRALESLRTEFGASGKAAEAYFASLYGDESFLRHTFLQSRFNDPKASTDVKDMVALIGARKMLPSHSLSNQILDFIFDDRGSRGFTNEFDGFYRYWRHYPTEKTLTPVRWGVINLKTGPADGTRFKHWSHDWIVSKSLRKGDQPAPWSRFSEPEDEGYSFFTATRIFLLGFRTNNIRSAIGSSPGRGDRKKSTVVNGIVLTTRKGSGGVFSAGFAMVHEDHPMAQKSLTQDKFQSLTKLYVDESKTMIHD